MEYAVHTIYDKRTKLKITAKVWPTTAYRPILVTHFMSATANSSKELSHVTMFICFVKQINSHIMDGISLDQTDLKSTMSYSQYRNFIITFEKKSNNKLARLLFG